MGMWNGIGGQIEGNETPIEEIIREALEETGIALDDAIYAWDVLWESNRGNAGMYLFLANMPCEIELNTPMSTVEGILEQKNIEWILDSDNKGIVDNAKIYLPYILSGQYDLQYHFTYKDGVMLEYSISKRFQPEYAIISSANKN